MEQLETYSAPGLVNFAFQEHYFPEQGQVMSWLAG
jgi:hypothetical protein